MAAGRAFGPEWHWTLVGLPWGEARQILEARGLTYTSVVTAPPNRPQGAGELRVIAERDRPGGLEMVLAHREYQRREPGAAAEGQGGKSGPC